MDLSAMVLDLEATQFLSTALGVDDSRFAVDVGVQGSVSLIFGELLFPHRDRGISRGIIDSAGRLTPDGCCRVERHLQALLAETIGMDTSALIVNTEEQIFLAGKEPGYAVVVTVQIDPSVKIRNFYESTILPFIKIMTMITDAKTCGNPYLFDTV